MRVVRTSSCGLLPWPRPLTILSTMLGACAGGQDLNADLRQLRQKHGQDHILLEIGFPADYPTQPFSLRIVSPRCMCVSSWSSKPSRA